MSISCPSDDRAAAERRAYERTGNPLHAERAITAFSRTEQLPLWVRDYVLRRAGAVLDVEQAVLDGELSPRAAVQLELPRALGFVRKGWNAFRERLQLQKDTLASGRYHFDLWTTPGKPPKAAVADLGVSSRSIGRKAAKVRRILGWPKPTP